MKTVVYFCIQNNSIIQEKLEQYHMKYDLFPSGTLFQEEYIRFTLYKEDPAYQELQEILPASSGSWLDFSKQELEEAPWLVFRSSNMKLNSMNPHTFAFSCNCVLQTYFPHKPYSWIKLIFLNVLNADVRNIYQKPHFSYTQNNRILIRALISILQRAYLVADGSTRF